MIFFSSYSSECKNRSAKTLFSHFSPHWRNYSFYHCFSDVVEDERVEYSYTADIHIVAAQYKQRPRFRIFHDDVTDVDIGTVDDADKSSRRLLLMLVIKSWHPTKFPAFMKANPRKPIPDRRLYRGRQYR